MTGSGKKFIAAAGTLLALTAGAAELQNGAEFSMNDVPAELTVHVKRGGSVRFLVEENATTGYQWEATYAKNECDVAIEHRVADASTGLCGAPGKAAFTVTKNAAVQSPSLVEFAYRRSWEKGVKPAKTVRLVLYTIPGAEVPFGTNNYDAAPKDLSRWLEAIVWLDLRGRDIWTPANLKGRDL